jgi:hypothetical protein
MGWRMDGRKENVQSMFDDNCLFLLCLCTAMYDEKLFFGNTGWGLFLSCFAAGLALGLFTTKTTSYSVEKHVFVLVGPAVTRFIG